MAVTWKKLAVTDEIPVKATGVEADTGTDDAKFLTAKAAKDSHNIPSVVPSTSGNVLTSDGTDWISAVGGGSPTTLRGYRATNFITTSTSYVNVTDCVITLLANKKYLWFAFVSGAIVGAYATPGAQIYLASTPTLTYGVNHAFGMGQAVAKITSASEIGNTLDPAFDGDYMLNEIASGFIDVGGSNRALSIQAKAASESVYINTGTFIIAIEVQ